MPVGVYIRTAEHKAKLGRYTRTEAMRAKISAKLMGHPCSAQRRTRISEGKKNSNYVVSEATRAKLSRIFKGRIFTEEWKAKLKLARAQQVITEEMKARLRVLRIGVPISKEAKLKLSKAGKRNWRNPYYKEAQIKAQRLALTLHPNKPETAIMEMLRSICPDEFKFVGDGEVIIAGKNPDFININGQKQIIELFGDYWHRGENPKCRMRLFKAYGFETLIIWEYELKNPSKVAERITNFTKRNCFERLLGEAT